MGVIDMRNQQFYFGTDMTMVVYLPTASERETWTLTIELDTIYIFPLSSTGRVIDSYATFLRWSDIKSVATYTPRAGACATCAHIPVVNDNTGVDGFSVPVEWMRRLLPADGYAISFGARVSLPGGNVDNPLGRRLLSVVVNADSTTGVTTITIAGMVDTTVTPATDTYILNRDLGAPSSDTTSNVAMAMTTIGISVGAGVGIFALLAWKSVFVLTSL